MDAAPAAVMAAAPSGAQSTVLIVDDTPENLALLTELLHPQYRVLAAPSGDRALQIAARDPAPDLMLLDISMPGMDGFTVLERLRASPRTADLPVIFVTALDSAEDESRGLELGAVDYITKPLRPAIVLARLRTQLEARRARDWLRDHNALLEAEVARRMADNQLTQDIAIHTLARLAEVRDNETGNHLHRTRAYVRTLARRLRERVPAHAALLDDRTVELIARSALLHDIGKVGIPDHILLKPGKFTPAEWEVMKTHARLGSDAIERAQADVERPLPFLRHAQDIARHHHERWDGSGYPDRLAGAAIPLPARLMALADVFDALISRRVYKPAFPLDEARAIIEGERGRHFDPDIVDAFIDCLPDMQAIAERFRDDAAP